MHPIDVPVAGGTLATFRICEVPDVNHYTIVMGAAGSRTVAQAIVRALQSPAGDPGLRSAG